MDGTEQPPAPILSAQIKGFRPLFLGLRYLVPNIDPAHNAAAPELIT